MNLNSAFQQIFISMRINIFSLLLPG